MNMEANKDKLFDDKNEKTKVLKKAIIRLRESEYKIDKIKNSLEKIEEKTIRSNISPHTKKNKNIMGNDEENMKTANTDKTTYNKTISNMKIGVCEMQGWRRTMEDAAIVLPNFEKNTSLFGILDGHGGSIISEFVSVNFKNILVKTKAYEKGEYEQALVHTFLIMDELLKDKNVNNFIVNTHNKNINETQKEENKKEHKNIMRSLTMVNSKKNIVKLTLYWQLFPFH